MLDAQFPVAVGAVVREAQPRALDESIAFIDVETANGPRPFGFGTPFLAASYGRREGPAPTAGTANDDRPFGMARGKGFEPLAFGSGVGSGKLAGDGQVSQALGISGKQADQLVTDSDAFTPFRSSLGIPLVSSTGVPRGPVPERLLTVREVAKALNVSASTVYKLCAERKLAHVRVSNAIRVHPAALAGWSGDEK